MLLVIQRSTKSNHSSALQTIYHDYSEAEIAILTMDAAAIDYVAISSRYEKACFEYFGQDSSTITTPFLPAQRPPSFKLSGTDLLA